MLNKIPHEVKIVEMFKGEHMSKDYAKINPAKQIPALMEVDKTTGESFILSEHGAIMRYIAQTRGTPDHWYPSDPIKRARVDEYLDLHHSFLRMGSG